MDILQTIEKEMMPVGKTYDFQVGDTIKVHYKIIEGDRERIQIYEGIVIAIDNKGISKTFTVRKISFDIGVERIFPMCSPRIAKIEHVRKGKAKRAKLYYLRERTGKSGKLKEKRTSSAGSAVKKNEVAATDQEPVQNQAE
jgi:large subunit ribosomal protein L19